MSYKVVAACVLAKDQQGKIHYQYEGAIIPWLSDEQADHFLAEGLVEESDVELGGGEDSPPAKSAAKAEWVDFAVSQGADQEEAEAMTKDDLIELYGK